MAWLMLTNRETFFKNTEMGSLIYMSRFLRTYNERKLMRCFQDKLLKQTI